MQRICDMEYISVINKSLEYSLDDNHTVIDVFFQSTSIHATVFHAVLHLNFTDWNVARLNCFFCIFRCAAEIEPQKPHLESCVKKNLQQHQRPRAPLAAKHT